MGIQMCLFFAPSDHYVFFSILMLLTVIREIQNSESVKCKRWKRILQLCTFHFVLVGTTNTEQITTSSTYTQSTGKSTDLPKGGRSPWQSASYSGVEMTQKSGGKRSWRRLSIRAPCRGAAPALCRDGAMPFPFCDDGTQANQLWDSPADICVLFEDKIWAILLWICYKSFLKLLLAHIFFSSSLDNSVFEASRALKRYMWEMLFCLLKTAPGIMSWLNSCKYTRCQRQIIYIGCTS